MEQCERCSRLAETAWSCAAGAIVCERCHGAACPPGPPIAASTWRAPRRPKPTPKAKLLDRVWRALEGGEEHRTVFVLEPGLLAGYCPACHVGTVSVRFVGDVDRPRTRTNGCSDGCSSDDVARTFR